MAWDAASYPAPPRQVFMVTRPMLVRSLLLSIGMIVFGVFFARAGQMGFGLFRTTAGLFGLLLVPTGVVGIGQVAWGFHQPSQLVLTADGFEWTSPWPRAPARRTWLECGPFFLVYRNRHPGATSNRVLHRLAGLGSVLAGPADNALATNDWNLAEPADATARQGAQDQCRLLDHRAAGVGRADERLPEPVGALQAR